MYEGVDNQHELRKLKSTFAAIWLLNGPHYRTNSLFLTIEDTKLLRVRKHLFTTDNSS